MRAERADADAPGRARRDPLSRFGAAWIVAGLLVISIALRATGLGHQLPHKPEADAVIVHQAAWLDRPANAGADEAGMMENFYPYLLAYALVALPGHAWPKTLAAEEPIERHLEAAAEPYFRARILIACLSLLLIPATYRIARHFLERGPACFAAALVATSQLATFYSQQARPHAAVAALSALTVMLALRHLRVGGWASLAMASLAALVALGTLHNGVFAMPALVCAWWFAPRRRLAGILLPVAAGIVALVVFYPFLFAGGLFSRNKLDIGGQTVGSEQFAFRGLQQIAAGLMRFDPVLSILALLGACALVVLMVRRRRVQQVLRRGSRRELLVAAALPVSFIAFWSVMQTVWERFDIMILPFLATLAAGFCAALLTRLVPRAPRGLAVVAALIVLAFPAYVCARLVWLRAHADSQTLAARWLETHADPARDIVGMPILISLPIWSEIAAIRALPLWARSPWEQYQLRVEGPVHPTWNLVPLFTRGDLADKQIEREEVLRALERSHCTIALVQLPVADQALRSAAREVVREQSGAPVAAWVPHEAGIDPEAAWLTRLLAERHWGPPLELYRLSDK